ncbi:hypothetical protein [Massilia sp. LjRoot122]|uniref:Nmad2 family putative nucleotide modification protein n=1 Tax=Massilia sp. LjRoot122 TaxID=3342257 RepID=UPI003ECFCC42
MLYSYALRSDDGAAPNPFGGVCTLAICKPKIRHAAQIGDWIVAIGPTNAPGGRDLSRHVVCAMRVSDKLTFAQYDKWCQTHLLNKLPNWKPNAPFESLVGDCIYYYEGDRVKQRKGVHNAGDMKRDLGGEYVLLSKEYYYFGVNAVLLPAHLEDIRHPWVGHRSHSNAKYEKDVLAWIKQGCGAGWEMGKVHGDPIHRYLVEKSVLFQEDLLCRSPCAPRPYRPADCPTPPHC